MRPNSLAEAVESIRMGASQDVVLAEFVDVFDLAPTNDARYETITEEPVLTKDKRLDALVGAIAEYLAKQYRLGSVPSWASGTSRYLDRPWHTSSIFIDWTREVLSDGFREYLTFASPPNSHRATSSPRNGRCGGPVARNQSRHRPA
jgi:hypothetical protein